MTIKNIKKLLRTAACAILLTVAFPLIASAQTTAELQAQIQALLQQIAALQAQLVAQAPVSPTSGGETTAFSQDLSYGSKGPEVARLQQFLILHGYLAPDLSTGNFYTLTFEALKRYQLANAIPATGYFGPITREKVNDELIRSNTFTSLDSPVPVTPISVAPTPPAPTAPATIAPPGANSEPIVVEPGYTILPRPQYVIADLEILIQQYVSAERTKNGLNPLLWNPRLADTARLHSQDQAKDNPISTADEKPCSYPYIRHEGFAFGFHLSDRLESRGIAYAIAGENIAAFSFGKNFLYTYPSDQPPITCPDLPATTPAPVDETEVQARARVDADILKLNAMVNAIPSVRWIQKQWLAPDEIAHEITDGWMNSPGHRKNILEPRFVEGGMGIAIVNDYVIATHNMMKGF